MAYPEPDIDAIIAQYPDWGIVDAVRDQISGGVWALGADGGVFALDGAPFLNSYWSLKPEERQGERTFERIERNDATGGYRLISHRGEVYEAQFGRPGFTAGSTDEKAKTPDPSKPAPPGADATKVGITALLKSMNLTALVDDAWKFWTDMGDTATMEAVNVWIRDQPSFKDRFPAMEYLESKGRYWTPSQYITYEQTVKDTMRSAGIPAGFWDDPTDISSLIQNDWSADEVVDAIGEAENAVLNLPPAAKAQMQAWGLTNGDMVAYWLNPDKGRTLAQRKQGQQQGIIGASFTQAGFGAVSQGFAEAARQNVGVEGVARNVEELAGISPIFSETAGERSTGDDMGSSTAHAFAGGTTEQRAAAARRIDRRRQSRTAAFEGGGGAASGGRGTTGLGSS